MLSKCANPECSEVFRYLHQGRIFHLSPTPEIQKASSHPSLHERFWLCTECSMKMTLVWGGTQVKLVRVPIAAQTVEEPPPPPGPRIETKTRGRLRGRRASAGSDNG